MRGSITRDFLTEPHGLEFPRVDDRRLGQRHDVVALGTKTGHRELTGGAFDAMLWVDTASSRTDRASWSVVFAGADPGSGPEARVRIPVRVPHGLHGAWLPTQE
ncbi:hypothetical protein GCM10023199_56280 [Actinomycetospora chibensis]